MTTTDLLQLTWTAERDGRLREVTGFFEHPLQAA